MFVRWQKRKRKSRAFGGGRDRADTHWAAILAESTRVDGKPTQQHVAYLGGITIAPSRSLRSAPLLAGSHAAT